jgi:hypothetical protein
MGNLFVIAIPDDPDALLVTYEAGALIRVQSCPTSGGVYGDVDTYAIVSGQTDYPVYDSTGAGGYWYKYRYEAADGDPLGSYTAAFQPVAGASLYASLAEFKRFARASSDPDADDDLMAGLIAAASRSIDFACGRTFSLAPAAAVARYYTSPGGGRRIRLPVDAFMDDTGLVVKFDWGEDGTYEETVTDYRLYPLNAAADNMPWTHIIFNSGVSVPTYEQAVQVTALWGWSAVPAQIKQATLLQASRLYKRRDAPFGVAGSPQTGSEIRLLAKLDPDVEVMVKDFIRFWPAVA